MIYKKKVDDGLQVYNICRCILRKTKTEQLRHTKLDHLVILSCCAVVDFGKGNFCNQNNVYRFSSANSQEWPKTNVTLLTKHNNTEVQQKKSYNG